MRETCGLNNFDYVRMDNGNIFVVQGDRHPSGRVTGFPVFTPDSDGDRRYNHTRMRKVSKNEDWSPEAGFYEPSAADTLSYSFPEDRIEQVWRPDGDAEQAFERLPEEKKQLVTELTSEIDEQYDIHLVGSPLVGLQTSSSDIDLLLAGEDIDFDTIYRDILSLDSLEDASNLMTPSEKRSKIIEIAERYGVPLPAVAHHLSESPNRRFVWTGDETIIDLIPSQQPGSWTDYFHPDTDRDVDTVPVENLQGAVKAASRSLYNPLHYRVETEHGELDLLSHTYLWRTLEAGDDVTVTGDLFPSEDTIYLRENGHFVAPAGLDLEDI